jgi:membrane protein
MRLVVKDTITDHVPMWSAAIAYYGLLSLFPLILAAAAIAAYFMEPEWAVDQVTSLLGEFMPDGDDFVQRTVKEAMEMRGAIGLVSIGILIWTGSRVFSVLTIALNIVYNIRDRYTLWQRLGVEFLITLSVGAVFAISLFSNFILGFIVRATEWLPLGEGQMAAAIRIVVPALLLFASFTLIYRFVPRGKQRWKAAMVGAVIASLAVLLARELFFWFLQNFGEYNLIYGSLAIVIVLLIWAWLGAFITLFGGEVASHYEQIVLEGKSFEEVEEAHEKRKGAPE